MKRKQGALWLACMVIMGVPAGYAQSPNWLDPNDSTLEQARAAKKDDVSVVDATNEIILAGRDPAQAVQSVIRVYNHCEALRQSVQAGSGLVPTQAQAIVEAVNVLPCLCSSESIWPHSRLEARIRPESRRMMVQQAPGSMCLSAAAEAAVLGAPDRAPDILKGAIGSARRGGGVLDSVGQVGKLPEQVPPQQHLKRDPELNDGCAQDLKLTDEFKPEDRFQEKPQAPEVLGYPSERRCHNAMDLLIDGVASAQTDNTAVVLRNDTGSVIDLEDGGYAIEVYFAGSDLPGRKVGLEGTVNPEALFVVASPDAEPDLRQMANLVTPSIRVSPGDSVVLKRGTAINDCRGVGTAIAAIANTLGTERGARWLQETEEEYTQREALRTVDSVGQAGAGPEMWQGAMVGQPMTLRRENDLCDRDVEPADGFSVAGGWRGDAGVSPESLGNASGRCTARSSDLVISQYANDAERYRAVEILNNTSGDVDLGKGGYMLEIYADGDVKPTQTVALEGKVVPGQAFVIADSDAPSEVRERSQMVTRELGLNRINALVLRKLGVTTNRSCAAEVIAVIRDVGVPPIGVDPINPLVPSIEPPGEEPGGEVASPN